MRIRTLPEIVRDCWDFPDRVDPRRIAIFIEFLALLRFVR